MINFRYHIVSLVAVFLALAVGIAAGVSIGAPVEQGLVDQASQDRSQVSELRAEITHRNQLDAYRQAYELSAGQVVAAGALNGSRVAVVSMPTAPTAVTTAVRTAVIAAGGAVVRDVQINDGVYDPAKVAALTEIMSAPPVAALNLPASDPPTTRFGAALAHAIADPRVPEQDAQATALAELLTKSGLANISADETGLAQLVIVVTAPAADPPTTSDILAEHLQVEMALRERAGVVLAGPNSDEIQGTDVGTARSSSRAADRLSTVDVADLSSGVTTTVLAGRDQLAGKPAGHYGALAQAQAVAPSLAPG